MTAQQTVFVVEDNSRMCAAMELLLRTGGYNVRSYPSAEAMLADETCVQSICLLTDVRLPGMDGLALHRRLVAMGAAPATVMITGHGDIPMAVAALKEGVVDFLEKPFHPPLLLESVKDASRRALDVRDPRIAKGRAQGSARHALATRGGGIGSARRRAAEQDHRESARHQRSDGRTSPLAHHGETGRSVDRAPYQHDVGDVAAIAANVGSAPQQGASHRRAATS